MQPGKLISTFSDLSDREKEVAELLSSGKSEKEIGYILKIGKGTVNNHTRNIRRKLGVTKNLEIMAAFIADYNGKKFDINKLRKCGIAAFLVFIHVCRLDV